MRRGTGRVDHEMAVMSESALQVSVARFLAVALPRSVRAVHVPNGGRRDAKTGARLKREGVRAGVADFVIFGQGGLAFMIELKTPSGRLSSAQKDWQNWCARYGFPYAVCRSLDEVVDVLRAWDVPLRMEGLV